MTELWQLAGYPWPWSRLEQAAWEAELEADELRDFLCAEIERRRAESGRSLVGPTARRPSASLSEGQVVGAPETR